MAEFIDSTFRGGRVPLDGQRFVRCMFKDANASRSSAGSAARSSFTRTAAMCPSTTFTRWHCALTANLAGVTRPASSEPRIFRVSRSIFSSSSAMNGITLS